VRDYGPGIPAEGRQRLFSRFGRIAGSRIRAGRVGTGLGLFLARQLARAMAGELELEDTGPQGTIFCLRLPLVLEANRDRASSQQPALQAGCNGDQAARGTGQVSVPGERR
jgi:signal transduction histidine kinase